MAEKIVEFDENARVVKGQDIFVVCKICGIRIGENHTEPRKSSGSRKVKPRSWSTPGNIST